MALKTLQFLLALLGAAAVGIGASIFIFGAQATATDAAALVRLVFPSDAAPALSAPDIDSELRFYAVLWAAYGAIALDAARRAPTTIARTPALAGLFFAGGVGRALSYALVGSPHPLFVVLMALELATPPVLVVFWLAARKRVT